MEKTKYIKGKTLSLAKGGKVILGTNNTISHFGIIETKIAKDLINDLSQLITKQKHNDKN
jgi:hypothetical protein